MSQHPRAFDTYVRDLGRCRVLDAEEQRRLAMLLRDPSHPQQEREAAKRTLLESNLRFAFALAKQQQGRGVDLADLVADANLGLTRALDHYDPRFGTPFIAYAAWWIRQAIREGIARQRHIVSVPSRRLRDIARLKRAMHLGRGRVGRAPTPNELAAATGLSLALTTALLRVSAGGFSFDDCAEDSFRNDQLDVSQESANQARDTPQPASESPPTVDDSFTHEALREALSGLSTKERDILMLSFGLDNRSAVTNEGIAEMLKMSPERVRQIRERALVRLRRGQRAGILHELWAD